MKEEWLMPDAVVPIDAETTAALVAEIKRLIGVVGDLALQQASPKREWVGLTDEERFKIARDTRPYVADTMRAHEEELKRRNT